MSSNKECNIEGIFSNICSSDNIKKFTLNKNSIKDFSYIGTRHLDI